MHNYYSYGGPAQLGVHYDLLSPFLFIGAVVGVIILILWIITVIWLVVDVIKHKPKHWIVWLLVIIFGHLMGLIGYYIIVKRERQRR